MVRTSPCYYISPSAISISPNANGSASDLAVNIVKGAKIKVYSQGIPALGWSDSVFQQWTLTGRNRRLADSTKPYTIYARLNKNNKSDGYLVFAPKEADGDNWLDKYAYVTMQGLATGTANKDTGDYWYIKLGEVSLPTDNVRTVTLDTGILGTDQFNTEWNLDPDDMPLRVDLSATIDLKDAGDKPYVPWGKELVLRAKLLQGWADTNIQRFHHWTIRRDTGDTNSDATYNYPSTNGDGTVLSSGRQMPGGNISLSHARGEGDVFNGTVSSLWTVTAWGTKTDSEGVDSSDSSSSSSSSTDSSSSASSSSSLPSDETPVETYEKLAETTINILAETVEQFALELSSGVVNYDPSSDTYSPADGINVMVRATDQRGDVFKLTNAQLKAAGLSVQYSLTNLNQWNTCTFSGADTDVASANIPIEAFHLQQNVDVRILKIVTPATAETAATTKEIFRSHIALVRNGEDSKEREWIFLRSKTALQFSTDAKDTSKPLAPSLINGGEVKPEEAATGDDTNKNQDGWVPEGWWDEMRGTDSTYHYEYAAYRDYIKGESQSSSSSSGNAAQRGGHWGDFTAPRIWSYYAEDAVSYRCRWTLAGVEVYQLKCAYTGAFRGTLPLVATLLKRVGSGQEQEVTGKTVVTLKCEGIDYAKTFNTDAPSFTVSTTDANTADFVQYLNKVELNGLSVSFTVNGEEHNFSIPVIREADEDSVKGTIDTYGSKKFLRKDRDDETTHKLTMGEAAVKGDLTLGPNGTYSISKEGVAKLAGVVAEYLKSSNFRPGTAMGFDGQGYGVTKGTDGNYTLEIDNLIARMKMIVAELEVHEMSFIGGTVVMSSCGNRVDRVEALDADGNSIATADSNNPTLTIPSDKTADKFRCYFLASDGDRQIKNEWTVGQLARAKTNNIAAPGNYTDYQNRDYWRLVVGVSAAPVVKEGKQYHYIDLSNSTSKDIVLTDAAGTTSHVTLGGVSETLNSLPFAGDNIIGMGHCLDDTRKNVAILSVDSLGWKLYKGIDHYDLPEENIVNQFSIDKTIVTTDHFVLRPYAAPKETQTVAVVRGPYSDKNDYGHNDLTTLDGQTWIGSGIPIGKTIKGERPSATSPYWSLAAAKGIQGDKGDGYSIAFLLNNVPVDVINFDTVKGMEGSEVTLEADFYNNAVSTNVNKAVITCYDADGNILGSPIEATKADNIVVDGGNLYLSKLCAYITTIAYDAGGKMLVSKSIGVVRNGESVGVKSVTYKVINDVDAGTPLNWDSVTAQTTYPTQKPPKGKYCYVMTIVAYSDGTTTNTVSTSYTPMDGNDGTSVKVTSTKVEYAGSDSGTTPPSSGWQTAVPQLAQGKYLWTRTTVTYSDNNSTTSYSVGRIGIDGRTPIITIGTNGNWLIDGNDSGQKAQGNAGHTPTVTIGPDGYWYIDGVRTSQKAQGDKGDNYSVTFLLNGARVDVLNFDDVRTLTEATFEADFYNQGTTVNIPKATLTCYDKEGNVLGSPIEITNTNNIVADGGNLYLSKDCKTITAVGKDGEKVLFSSSVAVIRSTITYRLIPMSDCSATVKASGTSTSAQFRLSYNLHYKAAKLVGDRAEDATIATIAATIEGKEITTPVNNTEGTLKEDGALNYTSDKRPADSIPVTVTLSDGTVLYDNVPVTMEAGVAIDINQNLGKFSLKVQAMSSVLYAESHQKNDTEDASYATFTPGGGSRVWLATTNGRGTTWFLVRPDGTVYNNVHTYDTYDNASLCDTMATDLYNTRSSSMILVVLSYDATSMTQKLIDELSWWGLDPTAIAPYSGQRNAFAFVGEANLGSGRGWWSLASGSGGKAVVNAMVSNGHVVAQYAGADAAQRRLLLATGVDIKDKKITATADKFVVNNNSGITTFYIDQDGNIVGAGNASFKGTITGSVINGSTIQSSYGAYTTTIQGGSIETNNIVASGGKIGEWTIKDGGLTTAYGSKACIEMRGPKSFFRLDSDNTTNGGSLLDIYNSSGRVISIVSEDSDEAALYIRNNASNRNLAISTFGNNSFLARVGEATTINRFAYACVRTGAVNVDFDDLFVSKETSGNKFPGNVIITTNYSYEQTVKFPSNPALGVQLIVIQGTNQKVHFDGNGHSFRQGSDVNSSANSAQNGQWNLFIFDGQYWQCIYITGHLLW